LAIGSPFYNFSSSGAIAFGAIASGAAPFDTAPSTAGLLIELYRLLTNSRFKQPSKPLKLNAMGLIETPKAVNKAWHNASRFSLSYDIRT
jgi:hypothetical protein